MSEEKMIEAWKLEYDGSSYITLDFRSVMVEAEYLLDKGTVGCKITIEMIEISKEKFDGLDEFDGF